MTNIKILALSMLTAISVNTAYAESTLTLGAGVGVTASGSVVWVVDITSGTMLQILCR